MEKASGRVAVIGDVGGHLAPLLQMLTDLGMDPRTRLLPSDLTVVQVGDLVHRGPHSAQVVRFVDHVMSVQPGQWVQLLGNHEQLHVAEPVFIWDEDISERAQETLDRWWDTGLMNPAAAIKDGSGDTWLVTHAGLTVGFWKQIGQPSNAIRAAATINALDRRPRAVLWRAGCMLGQSAPLLDAGPVWASSNMEVLPGWCEPRSPRLPFHQVHGHSMSVHPDTGAFLGRGPAAAATEWDPSTRHTTTATPSGKRIIGVDPKHGTSPASAWAPLLIQNAVVI